MYTETQRKKKIAKYIFDQYENKNLGFSVDKTINFTTVTVAMDVSKYPWLAIYCSSSGVDIAKKLTE